MPWLFLLIGAALLWAGWDALIQLGPVRPLNDRELARAFKGHGELSEAGKILAGRMVPEHNSLERLLAAVFVLVGAAFLAAGGWLVFTQW